MSNDFVFDTYHDNGEYADLSIYGYPTFILTKYNQLYDCGKWFSNNKHFGTVDQMKEHGVLFSTLNLDINPDPRLPITNKRLLVSTIFNNFFKAPWVTKFAPKVPIFPKNRPDLDWYKLNTYKLFEDLPDEYFGTNYGQVWSVVSGMYIRLDTATNPDTKVKCIQLKLHTKDNQPVTILSKLVSSYFINNPNPKKYNCIKHTDNKYNNTYYKNLKWVEDKSIKGDTNIEVNAAQVLPKDVVDKIIKDIATGVSNGVLKETLYQQCAQTFNVSIRCVIRSLQHYYDKDTLNVLTNPNLKNKIQFSSTPIVTNKCSFMDDYNENCEYALARSFGRYNVIITKDRLAMKLPHNYANKKFNQEKYKWPTRQELDNLPGLQYYSLFDENVVDSLDCDYLETRSIKTLTVIDNYFGNSPWYRKINGEDINFVQMNKHSEYANIKPYYFICDTGEIYSIKSGKYIKPKPRIGASIVNTEYGLEDDAKGINRSLKVLIPSFFNKEPNEQKIIMVLSRSFPEMFARFSV